MLAVARLRLARAGKNAGGMAINDSPYHSVGGMVVTAPRERSTQMLSGPILADAQGREYVFFDTWIER
jgi:hypothetical protein